jgi:hypothetical protein
VKFKFEPTGGFDTAFQEAIATSVGGQLAKAQAIMGEVSGNAQAMAQQLATQRLHSTAATYVQALKMTEVGPGMYQLTLDKSASHLEEGYPEFDMIQAGLARGEASVFSTKKGRRYVRIPFEHSEGPGKSGHHPMADVPIQGGPTTYGSLAKDLNALRQQAKTELAKLADQFGGAPKERGITTGPGGMAVLGTVYSMRKSSTGPQWHYNDAFGQQNTMTPGAGQTMMPEGISGLLSGLTKVQYQTKSGSVKAKYFTWRTASEMFAYPAGGKGRSKKDQLAANLKKWIHPGFDGAHIFPDLERMIMNELARRIQAEFGQES